jgi:hypothetical protein
VQFAGFERCLLGLICVLPDTQAFDEPLFFRKKYKSFIDRGLGFLNEIWHPV